MLALGARVYLNPVSPVLAFLKSLGAILHGTDRLAAEGSRALRPLSPAERETNRRGVATHWGRDAVRARTGAFLHQALAPVHASAAGPS